VNEKFGIPEQRREKKSEPLSPEEEKLLFFSQNGPF